MSGPRGLRRFPFFARLEIAAAAVAIRGVLVLLGSTVRWKKQGAEPLERCWREGEPVLMAFWHGRSILLPFVYRGRGACIMNSTHRDGEIVSRVLARFGIDSTRGSSTRGAVAGVLGLVRASRRGKDIALIPDGPRGPAGVAKAGAAELALLTGAPLFPVAVSCSRAWRLPTWDRMMLPYPFARVVMVVGEPLRPTPEGAGGRAAQRESLRAELETRLRRATADADRLAGRAVVEES
ncbi:MAG: lysophospholipid acyltransferase family protein [Candidatus Binatia bacterium]